MRSIKTIITLMAFAYVLVLPEIVSAQKRYLFFASVQPGLMSTELRLTDQNSDSFSVSSEVTPTLRGDIGYYLYKKTYIRLIGDLAFPNYDPPRNINLDDNSHILFNGTFSVNRNFKKIDVHLNYHNTQLPLLDSRSSNNFDIKTSRLHLLGLGLKTYAEITRDFRLLLGGELIFPLSEGEVEDSSVKFNYGYSVAASVIYGLRQKRPKYDSFGRFATIGRRDHMGRYQQLGVEFEIAQDRYEFNGNVLHQTNTSIGVYLKRFFGE